MILSKSEILLRAISSAHIVGTYDPITSNLLVFVEEWLTCDDI